MPKPSKPIIPDSSHRYDNSKFGVGCWINQFKDSEVKQRHRLPKKKEDKSGSLSSRISDVLNKHKKDILQEDKRFKNQD